MTSETLLKVIELAKAGQKTEAQKLLEPFLQANLQNIQAWLLEADFFSVPDDKIKVLEIALKQNPGNNVIADTLSKLKAGQAQAFANGEPVEIGLTKQELSSIQAGLDALEKDAIKFSSPHALVNFLDLGHSQGFSPTTNGSADIASIEIPSWLQREAEPLPSQPFLAKVERWIELGGTPKESPKRSQHTQSQAASTQTQDLPQDWLIGMSDDFIKSLQRLDKKLMGRVLEAMTLICRAPMNPKGDTIKPLTADLKGLWRYRIGDFRLVYKPEASQKRVTLLVFDNRGSVYQ